jgi:hypothetical protein
MSTPGVIINGKVVHAGGVPSHEKIKALTQRHLNNTLSKNSP